MYWLATIMTNIGMIQLKQQVVIWVEINDANLRTGYETVSCGRHGSL